MLALRLDDRTEQRLAALAARTGRTKSFYARTAIEAHLDDLEDVFLAEDRLRDLDPSEVLSLSTVKAALGLDD